MPRFQNESSCKAFHMKMSLHENEPAGGTDFNEWFRTQTRFDTKAQGNSELAYDSVDPLH